MKTLLRLTIPVICLLFCNFTLSVDKPYNTDDTFKKISEDIFKVLKDKDFKTLDKLTPDSKILKEVMKKMPARDKEPWKEFSSYDLERKINDAIRKQVDRLHKESKIEGINFSKIKLIRSSYPNLKNEKGFEQAEGSISISNSGNMMNIKYHLVKYKEQWYLMRIWY